jgi:hypothetical protein
VNAGTLGFGGRVSNRVYRAPAPGLRGFLSHALPRPSQPLEVNVWRLKMLPRTFSQFLRVAAAVFIGRVFGVATLYGRCSHRVVRGDGTVLEYGIAGYRVVTTAFVNYLVDALQADQVFEDFKYHGWGTGSTAEAVGDTGLVTELTTQYAVDNTRVTGTQAEAAANIYRTVATLDPDADVNLREHGVFRAATGATTLMDRTVFASINLVGADGDTLQTTYELTATAGG